MNPILTDIRQQLQNEASAEQRDSAKRFFKDPIECYGVKSTVVRKIAQKALKAQGSISKPALLDLCDALWQSGFQEEICIACIWSDTLQPDYVAEDIAIFERWLVKYVHNWASCDMLSNHTIGRFLMHFPQQIDILKQWAHSDCRWLKRSSAVSLIIPARKGLFLNDIFTISDTLLEDQDDMVQKGYGWLLKAASEANQQEVFLYVMEKKAFMPRTALRYAIEKMPINLRLQAMTK